MTDRMPRQIYRLLLGSMVLVPAIPLLLAASIGYFSYSATTKELAVSAIQQAASAHRDIVDSFLRERKVDLESFLLMAEPTNLSREAGAHTIANIKGATGSNFNDIGLIDHNGIQVAYVGPYELADKNYTDAVWYKETLRYGYYVSDVFLGYRNVPHFVVAVSRRVGNNLWVLRGTIDSSVFQRLVEKVSIGDTGEAYILDSGARFQTARRSGGSLFDKDPFPYPAQLADIITFEGRDQGTDYLFTSARINGGKWRLVVRQKRADAFASTAKAGYAILLILILGGAIIIGLACFASRKIYDTLTKQSDDVSQLENQLLRAARLAELGEMSAGFAHEINNPLQIMKSDLALFDMTLQDFLTDGDTESRNELVEITAQLKLQIDRCAGITREILKFGRYSTPELKSINLATYLPAVGAMVEKKALVHGISMHCDVATGTPDVEADPGQLQQVMVNLMNNAIHAVVERHGSEGGELRVTARSDGQGSAVIDVTDNGAGISQENLQRIFLPFFTTKAPGQGTGLGLSVCHSIIDSLGGRLDVRSTRGEGTTFTITLPCSKE